MVYDNIVLKCSKKKGVKKMRATYARSSSMNASLEYIFFSNKENDILPNKLCSLC